MEYIWFDDTFIIGIQARLDLTAPDTNDIIRNLWSQLKTSCDSDNIKSVIDEYCVDGTLVGLYTDYEDNKVTYTIGYRVSSCQSIPDGFVGIDTPACDFISAEVKGFGPSAIETAWNQSHSPDIERAFAWDFEEYDISDTGDIINTCTYVSFV